MIKDYFEYNHANWHDTEGVIPCDICLHDDWIGRQLCIDCTYRMLLEKKIKKMELPWVIEEEPLDNGELVAIE